MIEFLTILANLLGADRYAAHSICLTSDPLAISVMDLSNGLISLSYKIIGGILLIQVRQIARFIWFVITRRSALYLYGSFIFWCSVSHDAMILTMHYGVYWLEIVVLIVTAFVSAGTAWITVQAFAFPMSVPERQILDHFMMLLQAMLTMREPTPNYDAHPIERWNIKPPSPAIEPDAKQT